MISPVNSSSNRTRQQRPQPSQRLSHSEGLISASDLVSQNGCSVIVVRPMTICPRGPAELGERATFVTTLRFLGKSEVAETVREFAALRRFSTGSAPTAQSCSTAPPTRALAGQSGRRNVGIVEGGETEPARETSKE